MSGQSFVVYCNQLYTTEEKIGLLKKKQISYRHRVTDQYPFALGNECVNTTLFSEIMNAAAVFWGNAHYGILEGELWTLINDPANKCQWGLFMCSHRMNGNGESLILHYALCPLNAITAASRDELVSAILRANMLHLWGPTKIPMRLSREQVSNYRAEALISEMITTRSVQLIYGKVDHYDVAAWMDQIWYTIRKSGKLISSFYAYGNYTLEVFLQNRFVLPQLLLFDSNPFKVYQNNNWRSKLPLRGKPGMLATVISISSPIRASSSYGICLFPKERTAQLTALKDVPKVLGNSIHLNSNNLDDLIALEDSAEKSKPAVENSCYFLLHIRTNKRYAIVKDDFWIGRSKELDCPIDNNAVSRKHAVITNRRDGFYIQDQSTNGTFLNGEPLTHGHAILLEPNSQIVIGNEAFVFMQE